MSNTPTAWCTMSAIQMMLDSAEDIAERALVDTDAHLAETVIEICERARTMISDGVTCGVRNCAEICALQTVPNRIEVIEAMAYAVLGNGAVD